MERGRGGGASDAKAQRSRLYSTFSLSARIGTDRPYSARLGLTLLSSSATHLSDTARLIKGQYNEP